MSEFEPQTPKELIDFWFAPWGAWKGAVWEGISGDRPFDPNIMLELIRDAFGEQP